MSSSNISASVVLALLLVFSVLIYILIAGKIIKAGDGYGVYSQVQEGRCIDGLRVTVRECIPNTSNGRGCITRDGYQSYAPDTQVVPCIEQPFTSVWATTSGSCIDVSTDPYNPIYEITKTKTCVPTSVSTGTNGCLNTQQLSTGVVGVVPYSIGQSITWQEPCIPLTTINRPGVWTFQGSSTPIFNTQFISTNDCNTGESVTSSLLSEGIANYSMTCTTSQCSNLLPSVPLNSQVCNPVPIQPQQVRDKSLSPTTNPIMCTSTPPPIISQPCRLVPSTSSIDLGYGTDINILSNSMLLLNIDTTYTLAGIQTPSLTSNPQVKRYFNWSSSPLSGLSDTPIVYIDPSEDVRAGCTQEQISFSTGLLCIMGPRSIVDSSNFTCIISTSIPSSYFGWLSTYTSDVGKVAVWRQTSSSYISPGLFSSEAEQLKVEILSSFTPTPVIGYSGTIGSITVRIRTQDNLPIYIPSADQVTSNSTPSYKSLESVFIVVYPINVDISDRQVTQSPTTCNLYSIPL